MLVDTEFMMFRVVTRLLYELKYDGSESYDFLCDEAKRVLLEVSDEHTADSLCQRAAWVFLKEAYALKRRVGEMTKNSGLYSS